MNWQTKSASSSEVNTEAVASAPVFSKQASGQRMEGEGGRGAGKVEERGGECKARRGSLGARARAYQIALLQGLREVHELIQGTCVRPQTARSAGTATQAGRHPVSRGRQGEGSPPPQGPRAAAGRSRRWLSLPPPSEVSGGTQYPGRLAPGTPGLPWAPEGPQQALEAWGRGAKGMGQVGGLVARGGWASRGASGSWTQAPREPEALPTDTSSPALAVWR